MKTVDPKDKNLEREWIEENVNISKYLLLNYRVKSLNYNNSMMHKELSLARRLLLLLQDDQSKSCICYLDGELRKIIYNKLNATIPTASVPVNVTALAEDVKEAIAAEDIFKLDLVYCKYLTAVAYANCETQRAAASLLNRVFYGDNLQTLCRSNAQLDALPRELPASKSRKYETKAFQPDFLVYAWLFGHRFDLFVVEVKPPKSTMAAYDWIKMSREMKHMLEKPVMIGVKSPRVCGLWVDGYRCKTYTLEIKHDGIYKLIQLSDFDLPRKLEDIVKVRSIMKHLLTIKSIIETTKKNIELAIRRSKKGGLVEEEANEENVPRPCWLRDSPGEELRVTSCEPPKNGGREKSP
ncbi:unnamed protein product [Mucor hiemalis]